MEGVTFNKANSGCTSSDTFKFLVLIMITKNIATISKVHLTKAPYIYYPYNQEFYLLCLR